MSDDRNPPNTMINDVGDLFYPDNPDDADWFIDQHGARWMYPDRATMVEETATVGRLREAITYAYLGLP